MSALSRLFAFARRSDFAHRRDGDDFSAGFDPVDRIGQPFPRRRSKVLRRGILLLGLSGLGYASYQDPSMWPKAWSIAEPIASSLIDAAMKSPAPPSPAKPTEPPLQAAATEAKPNAPAPASEAAALPPPVPSAAKAPEEAAQPPARSTTAAAAVEEKPPADEPQSAAEAARDAAITAMRPPLTDPLQKRAEAAGLHPDLSRAVLERLTAADYQNAVVAIRKALTATAAGGVVIWPEKADPDRARFHVSFVPSPTPDCRRYVVAIAKDGWQTTALPVEKCGVKRAQVQKG